MQNRRWGDELGLCMFLVSLCDVGECVWDVQWKCWGKWWFWWRELWYVVYLINISLAMLNDLFLACKISK